MTSKVFCQQKSPVSEKARSVDPEKKEKLRRRRKRCKKPSALDGQVLPMPMGFLRPCRSIDVHRELPE
jgi:hypothetical protein